MKHNLNKPGAIIIEGHIQGLSNTRSLGEHGIPVIVVDTGNCIARYSKYCSLFAKCPPYNCDELVDFLIRLKEKHRLNNWVLIPSNDHAVHTISRNKKILEKHFKSITPGLEVIDQIYNKINLISLAGRIGVPTPKTYFPVKNPDEVPPNFPVLSKGCFGLDFYKATGRKAFLSNNRNELAEHLDFIDKQFSLEKTFVQEVIPFNGANKTISFTGFCLDGELKTYWMGVKIREHPVRFGTATFAESIFQKDCYEYSIRLINELKYTGVCEIEYLFDHRDSEYKLIEINARTWLWVSLAKVSGIDFAKIIYSHLNQQEIAYPVSYITGVKWINIVSDSYIVLKSLITNLISFNDLLLSYKGIKTEATFNRLDLKPFIMYLLFIPIFILKR